MSNLTRLQKFLLAIGVVIVITLGFFLFKSTSELTITKTQLQSITDTLVVTRDKYGKETATRKSIAGDLKTTQALLAIANAPKPLQDMAKDKNVIVGVVGQTTSSIDTTVSIKNDLKQVVSIGDVKNDSAKVIHEDFVKTISNEWYSETVTKKGDSLTVNPKFVNKYEDKLTQNGNTYTWTSKNLNPYTSTQEIRSFNVTPPKVNKAKIFAIGGGTGAAIVIILKTLIIK